MQFIQSLLLILRHPLNQAAPFETIGRLIWWKLNQLFFQLPTIIQLTPSTKCICYPNSSYGGMVVYMKWPDFAEMKLLSEFLTAKSTFIDIGAGIGEYTLLAADKVTNGRIFAFEPSPVAGPLLQENLQLNGLSKRVEVSQKLVSDKGGTASFLLHEFSEMSHIATKEEKGEKVRKVPVVSLDEFCRTKKIATLSALKIDVEGAEPLVLQGAKQLLKKHKIELIVFELNANCHKYGFTPTQVVSELKKYGYEVYEFTSPATVRKVSGSLPENARPYNLLALSPSTRVVQKVSRCLSGI